MSRNGNGTYSLPAGNPVTSGSAISSTIHNNTMSDIATALTASIANDGQTPPVANLPMGGFKHTGVADGSTRDQYAAVGQVQDSSAQWAGTAGGTANAITLILAPAITAYAAGQSFTYKSGASANTGAMTAAVSGLAAKAIEKNDAALASGDHPANMWFRITYDGVAFQLEQIAPISAAVTTALALKANSASPSLTTPTIAGATITGAVDMTGASLSGGTPIVLEGATANGFETSVVVVDPTADRTITVPNADVDLTNVRQATDALPGYVELGTESEVETGTDPARVAPISLLKNHRGVAKAWIAFNGTGAVSIIGQYGVSSITDNGVGDYTINLSVTLVNTNYAVFGFAEDDSASGGAAVSRHAADVRSTTAVRIRTLAEATTAVDCAYVCVAIFGDL